MEKISNHITIIGCSKINDAIRYLEYFQHYEEIPDIIDDLKIISKKLERLS